MISVLTEKTEIYRKHRFTENTRFSGVPACQFFVHLSTEPKYGFLRHYGFINLLLFHSFGDELLRVILYRPSWYLQSVLEEQANDGYYFR